MPAAPRIPLVVEPVGIEPERLAGLPWAAAFAACEAPSRTTRWLRAPEHAPTIGEARLTGEAYEAAAILGQLVRAGEARADDGARFTGAAVICSGPTLAAARWLAGDWPWSWLDANRFVDLERSLEALHPRFRETLFVVVHPTGDDAATRLGYAAVASALGEAGLDDLRRWVAICRPRTPLWERSARWRARLAIPPWAEPEDLATSALGALVCELGGTDAVDVARAARDVDEWAEDPDWGRNPVGWLAGLLAGGPVAVLVDRAALEPVVHWATLAAASRGMILLRGDPEVDPWLPTLVLCGVELPHWVRDPALAVRIRSWEPRVAGALIALFERAFELAGALRAAAR